MVNKCFPITNITIYIIIIILCYFLLCENDISKIKQIIHFYKFYTKNKSAKLISSIQAIQPNEECPPDSSPLFFYEYPGTKEGCLISKEKLEVGSCSIITKIFKNYDKIEETNEKYFDVLYTKKLCAIVLNDNDYIKNLENRKNDNYCGKIDTIGNKYYVKNGEQCPINKIIIDNENKNYDGFTNNIELIKDEYYLHYSNGYLNEDDNSNFLLTNESFFISEGLPCINPGEINTYHIQYLLNKKNESYICNTFIENERLDNRYNLLSSINKKNLYEDNNINLDDYFDYPFKDTNLNLYQLGYIGMNKNFISDILNNSEIFISDINKIEDFNKYNKYLVPIIFSFIFLVIVNLMFKYFIVDITIYILNFILIAINIANLTLSIIIFFSLKNFKSLEEYYSDNKNDKIFNAQIKYINDIIINSKNINNKNIIGISLIIFLIILFDLINCCIFNNPNNIIFRTKKNIDYYHLQNKKIYNSINVLKPFEEQKENKLKFKKEIELSKISSINNDDNDDEEEDESNIINNSKSGEEEDILTSD